MKMSTGHREIKTITDYPTVQQSFGVVILRKVSEDFTGVIRVQQGKRGSEGYHEFNARFLNMNFISRTGGDCYKNAGNHPLQIAVKFQQWRRG
jgi:hypothetical protein